MLDNNDGITVIDVTDPEAPAYCFVSICGLESDDTSNIKDMTPLSATQYLRSYYPKGDSEALDRRERMFEQSILDTLHPFESVRMITIDMLAEAWPWEYASDGSDPATSIHMPTSLVDMTFVPALNYALQTGQTDCLDLFMCSPKYLSKIKETLRAHNPISAIDLALLSKVIAIDVTQTKSIDLSHFSLTEEQLIELLSAQEGVEVLNISHMQQITKDNLRQLIPHFPNLRRLVLLHTISDADILSLLSESPELFYRIDSLIHSAFLRRFGQAVFPAAFSHITTQDSSEVVVVSVPYFTPGQLVQALTDYFSVLMSEDIYNISCLTNAPLSPLLATYASAVREPGRSWSERIVPFIPRKTSDKLNARAREGWFFTWSATNPYLSKYRYAFAKTNKEVTEECQRRIDDLRESFKLPSQPDPPQNFEGQAAGGPDAMLDEGKDSLLSDELRAKEDAIKSEYADQEFHIFDVESFFQELVKEGRPAPPSEALTKLLEIFTFLKKGNDSLCVMTPADLRSFLKRTNPRLSRGEESDDSLSS